jgi:hypothetical protein
LPRPIIDRLNPIDRVRLKEIRKLGDGALLQELATWKKDSPDWIALSAELRRRESWTSRWALGVSIAALVTSFVALAIKVVVE